MTKSGQTLIFAQKYLNPSNNMAVSYLWLHAVFCKISVSFPFLRKRTDFGAVRNANIIQADGQCAILQLLHYH